MKIFCLFALAFFCFSFRPSPTVNRTVDDNSANGFYIFVEDYTDRTNHKYIVETKDSVQNIFNFFFESELALGNIDRPITIYNGKRNFYIARVNVYRKPNGKLDFRHLKYTNPYVRPAKRQKLKTVTL